VVLCLSLVVLFLHLPILIQHLLALLGTMGLKSYFAPGKGSKKDEEKKGHGKKAPTANNTTVLTDLTPSGHTSPSLARPTPVPGSTPGVLTPGDHNSPYGSRPASVYSRRSLYPAGDFRNSARESLLDVKADVMCSWLFQRQMEKQYVTGMLPGEGVVIKKGKNSYACCPPQLRDLPGSLYEMAMELNVRVCLLRSN
jgi:hypothetical protein